MTYKESEVEEYNQYKSEIDRINEKTKQYLKEIENIEKENDEIHKTDFPTEEQLLTLQNNKQRIQEINKTLTINSLKATEIEKAIKIKYGLEENDDDKVYEYEKDQPATYEELLEILKPLENKGGKSKRRRYRKQKQNQSSKKKKRGKKTRRKRKKSTK